MSGATAVYKAFAFDTLGLETKLVEMTPVDLKQHEVCIQTLSCAICHSDLHSCLGTWPLPFTLDGKTGDKMIVSHEVIGVVTEVGPAVTSLAVGTVVGVGWQKDCCKSCDLCQEQLQSLCPKAEQLIYSKTGRGLAEQIICDATFALPIPEGIDVLDAAPLFCAGTTTWAPINRWVKSYNTRKLDKANARVAVQGLGGLGSIAVQFLVAMGFEQVYAITRSEDKRSFAESLGCKDILISADVNVMAAAECSFDFVFNTASGADDDATLLKLLKPRGCYSFVTPTGSCKFDSTLVLFKELMIFGTLIAPPHEIAEMLTFCAAHKIKPITQVEKLQWNEDGVKQVNDALVRVNEGKVRFRQVFDYRQ